MLADCFSMRTRTWRCVLVLLIAVAGVVTGILAMHVVSTPMSQMHQAGSEPVVTLAAASHTDQSHTATVVPSPPDNAMSTGCAAGECDPMHDMTAMVCTLALLAVTILLIAPALGRALLGVASRAVPANLARRFARSIGALSPPSLVALSVDRR
ncbi:DUF6153 family protein [Leifsonia sp. TF02-11]|uniref:DUF6153 family protein n=1 Tax=Leifsonia sp. TF02-11 TaxID=2815212 RepID=UPI001AA12A18|nr:DUF6153 family protein [Leifsonia sp. TF02-11]MBO1741576.1 hypothetical protein [Leifsonia sp. TF02-11]